MSEAAAEVFGAQHPLITRYVDILSTQGVEWGLIGPREADRLWERHILNSVAVHELVPVGAEVVDVGSGAGLPGIPLAILRPDLAVTLVEPLLRRSNFLTQAVDNLGISDRVRVVRSRAEDHHEAYDVVLSRALAPLDRLIRWCAPLRRQDGAVLALKGSSAADEVQNSRQALAAAGLRATVMLVRASAASEPTTVVRMVSR